MESYEIGTRVPTRRLRVGDRFGENLIEDIIRDDGDGEDSEYREPVSIRVTGGAWHTGELRGDILVPDNHSVTVEVGRLGRPEFAFGCRTYRSPCSLQCARCGRYLLACDCPEDTETRMRLVSCRYTAYLNNLDPLEVLARFDGDFAALHSGPIMPTPDATGPGCRWRYPDRFAAFITRHRTAPSAPPR